MNVTERLAIALNVLATQTDVPGMANPHDEQERERLAVSIIRTLKEHAGCLTESDRLTARTARGVRVYANGHDISTNTQRHYFAGCIIADEQERENASRLPGMTFHRSRFVNVNGSRLKLRWIA